MKDLASTNPDGNGTWRNALCTRRCGHGTDGESRWKEVCDSERTCELYPERIGGDCPCEGDPGPPWPYDHDRAE